MHGIQTVAVYLMFIHVSRVFTQVIVQLSAVQCIALIVLVFMTACVRKTFLYGVVSARTVTHAARNIKRLLYTFRRSFSVYGAPSAS